MEKTKGSNIFQVVLVALLVGAAFYIGSLSSKVDKLEKDAVVGADNQAPSQPTAVAFDPNAIASTIGIDMDAFESCMQGGDAPQRVQQETQGGSQAGVSGTPGIILFDSRSGMSVVIPGAVDLATMQTFLDNLIAGKNPVFNQSEFELTKIEELPPLTDADFIKGDRSARITLFEYSDYDCPFCTKVHPTIQQLLDNNPGVISWVYRQFPLDMHPEAFTKSVAAVCAGTVGGNDAFWAYSDALLK